jgi:uncharacterized Zn finger protein
MSARDTAQRLQLPCPLCDNRGVLAAYSYGKDVAVSCTACGHVWTEWAYLHVVLRRACEDQLSERVILPH